MKYIRCAMTQVIKGPPYFFRVSACVVSGLLLAACNPTGGADLLKTAPGAYDGTIVYKRQGSVEQSLFSARITAPSSSELEFQGKDSETESGVAIFVERSGAADIALTIPASSAILANSTVILKQESGVCYSSAAGTVPSAGVCFNGSDLTVDVSAGVGGSSLHISVSRADPANRPVFESPRAYSITELIQRAMDHNFDSAIEFQSVVQAKLKTETDYLNLLPHLNTNDVLNIASLNILNELKTVGDIAPFLFPTRWIQAAQVKDRTEAEFDAWILTKADAANITEGLAYGILRDEEILAAILKNRKSIASIRDEITERERIGLMQAGSSDDVAAVVNSIDRGYSSILNTISDEKMALAQAAGFFNYAAVSDITGSGDDTSLEGAQGYDAQATQTLTNTVLDRSYELRQLDALTAASKLGLSDRFFEWLDPAGDRDGGLGFNLATYVPINKAQTAQLTAERDKVESNLMETAAKEVGNVNQFLDAYRLAKDDLDIQNRRVQRHLSNLKSGINFSMSDLTSALQGNLDAEIQMVETQYGYLIGQGELNRLLLAGPYAHLPVVSWADSTWLVHTNVIK
jgi:hypothetical protein